MLYNAKNGVVELDGAKMEYLHFGSGQKTLIMLSGLGDSLRSPKGLALPIAIMYRKLSKGYTVYMFGRRDRMPADFNTNDMADDLRYAMDHLGINKAGIIGVSMVGMIAQHFAADHPNCVDKLVLVVSAARNNPMLIETINEWLALAKLNDHGALMESNLRRIYSPGYYRRNKWLIPIVGRLTKPKSYDAFITQANACITHNAFDKLSSIKADALVIGGKQDNTLTGKASEEIAEYIPNAKLKMYEEYGHGLYDEAKDFQRLVHSFLQ